MARQRPVFLLVICAALVLALGMGLRGGFGLFMEPMGASIGVSRESFGLAIALQSLIWGLTQPFFGALSDKYGAGRVISQNDQAHFGTTHAISCESACCRRSSSTVQLYETYAESERVPRPSTLPTVWIGRASVQVRLLLQGAVVGNERLKKDGRGVAGLTQLLQQ